MKVWIDLDNTPHVPFFQPIIRELERRGIPVVLTARDAFQVCQLVSRAGLNCRIIGRHYGKSRVLKVAGLLWRALQLAPFARRERPALALSHGSRAQLLISNVLRIPTVMLMDYEHARTPLWLKPRWEIVPETLHGERLHCPDAKHVRTYPGIKEDVYVPEFVPDPALATELGLSEREIVVTVRPPATEAHYHNPEGETLFEAFMERACQTEGVRVVMLPRNSKQQQNLQRLRPQWFAGSKVVLPRQAVNGLNLLWHSDLVVSGGGTMNREAAALGVPVYSIFRGPIGAVDRKLQAEHRLELIQSVQEVQTRIRLERRPRAESAGSPLCRTQSGTPAVLETVVRHVEEILRAELGLVTPLPEEAEHAVIKN